MILRYKDSIRGLTTAAAIWVACAVGLAIGAGFYLFGGAVTGLTLRVAGGAQGPGAAFKKGLV